MSLIGKLLENNNFRYAIKDESYRGLEKITRLDSFFKNEPYHLIYAVSDYFDDKELLQSADDFLFI